VIFNAKLSRLAILFAATCLAPPALAAPAEGPDSTFTGRDLFDLSAASDPQISPDGRHIAYVRLTNDIMTDRARPSIWLVDTATGRQIPLVTGAGAHSSPRWSPDGTRLAYVSTAEGGASQLFVRWMAGGEAARVTGLPDSPDSIAWSPDGRQIAYVMNVPDEGLTLGKAPAKPEGAKWADPLEIIDAVTYRADGAGYLKPGYAHLFLVDADGGAPRQLTWGKWNDGGPLAWTPDAGSILFSTVRQGDWQRDIQETDIYSVDLAGGAPRRLTTRKGPDFGAAISPDGRQIAYLGWDDTGKGFDQASLYLMNRDGSGARPIAAGLDRGVEHVEWTRDGRALVAIYEEDGGKRVSRIGLDGRVTPLASGVVGASFDRPYAGGDFTLARNGAIAFTTGDVSHPANVAYASGGNTRTLTQFNDFLAGRRLGEVRELAVRAPDGGRVPAWLVTPPNYVAGTRVPMILEIHGGPYASYGPQFATDMQLYAASGYAVLYTNPRGSTGYGQAFADGIEKTYPDSDYADLMAAVDAAVASGIADPDNLFVTGGSGGGILTAWIVGKTDRFKAAAAQKPVINWTTQALTADGIPFFARYWMGKMPWEDPQGYWARSPISLVGNMKTPTLVVVGSEDYRTPVSEAEQLYAALQLKGVPTALVKVPGASHGGIASRPSQSAAKAAAIIAWFDKYRRKAPPAQ
jgi:dipeptidyl aminopeptidase/acylaminoacyl peptidase